MTDPGLLTRVEHGMVRETLVTVQRLSDSVCCLLADRRVAEADMVREGLALVDCAVGDLLADLDRNADRDREGDL